MRSIFAYVIVAILMVAGANGNPDPDPQMPTITDMLAPLVKPVLGIVDVLVSPLGGINGTLGGINGLSGGLLDLVLSPLGPILGPLGVGVGSSNLTNPIALFASWFAPIKYPTTTTTTPTPNVMRFISGNDKAAPSIDWSSLIATYGPMVSSFIENVGNTAASTTPDNNANMAAVPKNWLRSNGFDSGSGWDHPALRNMGL